jgi:hypothetical protein
VSSIITGPDGGPVAPHRRQITFEAERVRLVLARFGLAAREFDLRDRQAELWALKRGWLTFETFRSFFPSFPIVLEARALFNVGASLGPAVLFRVFTSTFVMNAYLEVYTRLDEEAAGRPIGLVIPFDGFVGGMVIHNGDFHTRGTRLVHDLPGDVPPHRVTIEPFIPVVDYLARGGWTPNSTRARFLPTQGPKVRRGYVVRPWMNQALGCGPAKDVLGFLWAVLHTRSGYYRRFVRPENGERVVVIDHAGLARQTGLSEYQVKRGLARLHELGIVTTQRRLYKGQMKSHFLVDRTTLSKPL